MRLSNRPKYFQTIILSSFLLVACGSTSTESNQGLRSISDSSAGVPFASKEPETYRTLIVFSSPGVDRRVFIARNGESLRLDFDPFADSALTVIRTDREYLILEDERVYTERALGGARPADQEFIEDLTRQLLTHREEASYEELDVSDAVARYRVRLNNSAVSDSIVTVDRDLSLPVKQEFYSIAGDERRLQHTVELQDLKLDVAGVSFEVPEGCRRVTIEEFYRILNK
jgi:hypothetical protein